MYIKEEDIQKWWQTPGVCVFFFWLLKCFGRKRKIVPKAILFFLMKLGCKVDEDDNWDVVQEIWGYVSTVSKQKQKKCQHVGEYLGGCPNPVTPGKSSPLV